MSADVTVIIVTHNSAAVLGDCLKSIPDDVSILIVDNSSQDHTREIALTTRPNARWIEAGGNLGYGTAANIGLRQVATPYAFVMNPDVILGEGALTLLKEAATRHPKAAMLGPKVLTPNGAYTPPKPPRFHPDYPLFALPWRKTIKKIRKFLGLFTASWTFDPEADNAVGWILGCTLLLLMDRLTPIITLNTEDQPCWFDEGIFMYFDEDDLAIRILDTGGEVWWIPKAIVTHLEGLSSGDKTPTSQARYRQAIDKSRLYMADKYPGRYSRLARWWWMRKKGRHLFSPTPHTPPSKTLHHPPDAAG
ncbi:MAG: glycosyltransferase family 2 protein [Alphaproteobacteria bacterium]